MPVDLDSPVTVPEKVGSKLEVMDIRVNYRIVTADGEAVLQNTARMVDGANGIPADLKAAAEVVCKQHHVDRVAAAEAEKEAAQKRAEDAAKAAEEAAAEAARLADEAAAAVPE